jgi:UDP-GlcNAc3NAcA epimerase
VRKLKVVTVVGARPQFVKAAAVSPVLRSVFDEIVIHTGQHYDSNMSSVFFEELDLQPPDYYLGIGSGSHGYQTARMLEAIENVLTLEKPDCVLLYGDTNSTLAGALAAAKLQLRLVHVEAGLRSFSRKMPEEVNRILTDHASDLLLAPTKTALWNLSNEGLSGRSILVGDVMVDILMRVTPQLTNADELLDRWGVSPQNYLLLTLHRPSNVDDPERLREILGCLSKSGIPVLFPIHPRTLSRISENSLIDIVNASPYKQLPPLGYREMLIAEANAKAILTDSGGVQKESYLLAVPCLTLRDETEWVETVETGWNRLWTSGHDLLTELSAVMTPPVEHPDVFGNGDSASLVVASLERLMSIR